MKIKSAIYILLILSLSTSASFIYYQHRIIMHTDPELVIKATQQNDVLFIKKLARHGFNFKNIIIPQMYKSKISVLDYAIRHGYAEMVRILLQTKLNINEPQIIDKKRPLPPPLWHAIESRNPEIVNMLLKAGTDVNLRYDNHSLFAIAARVGDPEIFAILLKAHPNVKSQQEALWCLASSWNYEIPNYLLKRMFSPAINFKETSSSGENLVHAAVSSNNIKFIRSICWGSSILFPLHYQADHNGFTPFMKACLLGAAKSVKYFVEEVREDVNQQNCLDHQRAPLHYLALYYQDPYPRNHAKATEIILKDSDNHQMSGFKLFDIDIETEYGDTPLLYACGGRYTGVAEALIRHHADVNKENIFGITPLLIAHITHREALERLLIQAGADKSVIQKNKIPPIVCAALVGLDIHPVLDKIFNQKARASFKTSETLRNLSFACLITMCLDYEENFQTLLYYINDLCSADAKIQETAKEITKQVLSFKDRKKNTLLHYAYALHRDRYLLQLKEIDTSVKNEAGETPQDFAKNHPDLKKEQVVLELLKMYCS